MRVCIERGRAVGQVQVPTSKSVAHRLLICAGLSAGESVIEGISDCEDVQATLDCLRALGVVCRQERDCVTLRGVELSNAKVTEILPCRESGSTLRFLIPVALTVGGTVTFTGYGRLPERPMEIYEEICRERGLHFCKEGSRITVGGGLPAGEYRLPGNVSSQFVSGLLFALPLAKEDSRILLTTEVESRSYIDLTLDAMRNFGVEVAWENERCLHIPGNQHYTPQHLRVEGDYSNAAFLEALHFLGGDVTLYGLRKDSLQGDRCYRQAMESLMNGKADIDLQNCPDLGPILFAVAAAKHGGVFTGTRRLRIKESDRVAVMQKELAAFGVMLKVEEDRTEVLPTALQKPSRVLSGHNDHRIVMALSVLLTLTGGEIEGAEAVQKSYPAFFEDLKKLGITVTENEL